MTTNWVLAGQYAGFPLTYHWRVLPDSTPLPEELAGVKGPSPTGEANRSCALASRLSRGSASVALYLEYIPQNVHQWLGTQVEAGHEAAGRACGMVEKNLETGTSFMNSSGLLHFDAHFENILTDGERLYNAGYGLANSSRFELSQDEPDFASGELAGHRPVWVTRGLTGRAATRWCAPTRRAGAPRESRRRPRRSSPGTHRSPQ